MAFSPGSSASSSDLYAASELYGDYSPRRLGEIEYQSDQDPTSVSGKPPPDVRLPLELGLSSEEKLDSGYSTPHFVGTLGKQSNKRKRDRGSDTVITHGAKPASPDLRAQKENSPEIARPEVLSDASSFPEPSPGAKRAKTNGSLPRKAFPTNAHSEPASLPPELWQHVFRFVPPVFLGRLLRVSHAFRSYLTSSHDGSRSVEPKPGRGIQPSDAEAIWAASRRRFAPGLPKPLRGLTELDMWRLLRGQVCQICYLLLSSDCPSFLLHALPFAFVSSALNYIPNTLLKGSPVPPSTHISKHYYQPHIQEIKRQLDNARDLGAASADEWSKGLHDEGKERINDAIRWEQWEAKGGLRKVNMRPNIKPIQASISTNTAADFQKLHNNAHIGRSTTENGVLDPSYGSTPSNALQKPMEFNQYAQVVPGKFRPDRTDDWESSLIDNAQAPYQMWNNNEPVSDSPIHPLPPVPPPPRPERSVKDANEAKAARRAEIERRCSLFHPPLYSNVLSHMESFQAAIQISTLLTDSAWDVLKPRLLAQRASAEKRELEQIQQNELIQPDLKSRHHYEMQPRESKGDVDRHWDSVQAPVRDRLGLIADAVINEWWSGGRDVTKENSPKFAADVLLSVRRRFYDESARESMATAVAGMAANGPPTQTLILENMKWVFDNKVKPFTEQFQKELFLCNGCDDNYKFYGFEGVIQHYAAKHTSALSMGSVVVYWRAEWPDEPPFNPEPSLSKSAYYNVPSPAVVDANTNRGLDQHMHNPETSWSAAGEGDPYAYSSISSVSQPTTSYHDSQTVGHNNSNPYPAPYYPGYSNPPPSAALSNGVSESFGYPPPNGVSQQWQPNSTLAAQIPSIRRQEFGTQQNGYNLSNTFSPYGTASGAPFGSQSSIRPAISRPPHFDPSRNNAAQQTEGYQQQMDEMAKQARDVWFSTSSIKDLPASVRIYVVIHHTAARFSAKYFTVPSLDMFLDGLDNKSQMRPVRSLNGLACKTCVTQHNTSFHPNFQSQPPAGDRRLYTLPHLLNHFRTTHLDEPQALANPHSGPSGPKHDWTRDMVELPESRLIADLVHCSGMDDNKLELIAWAFPRLFPSPLPKLGAMRSSGPIPSLTASSDFKNDYSRGFNSNGTGITSDSLNHLADDLSSSRRHDTFRPESRLSRASEPPGEDEYDPHQPAYWGRSRMVDAGTGGPNVITHDRREKDWSHAQNDRQVLETTDLSKLIHSATQIQSEQRRERSPERNTYLQHHSHSEGPLMRKLDHDESPLRDSANFYMHDDERRPRETENNWMSDPANRVIREENQVKSPQDDTYRPPTSIEAAAEYFLQNLGHTSEARPLNDPHVAGQRTFSRPAEQWSSGNRDGTSENEGQYLDGVYRPTSYRTIPTPQEVSPSQTMHASRSTSRSDRKTSPMYVHIPRPYDDRPYERAASKALIPVDDAETHERHPRMQVDYPSPTEAVVQHTYTQNGYSSEQTDRNHDGSRVLQAAHHPHRLRSPGPVAAEATRYFHPESFSENPEARSVYRVRSPLQHKDHRIHQPMYASPHRGHYGLVEDHEPPRPASSRYQQQIEYIPVRMGHSNRSNSDQYFYTQPVGQRGPADYVRVEDPYEHETVYEHDGQLYRLDARTYRPPAVREHTGSAPRHLY
ncbi:MAG: hypothetical protein Q9220_003269 [cf. Caloplaca sp. 1 TL-2023]